MRLYHISNNLFHNGLFYPRVPLLRLNDEDGITKRISFSTSIAKAISSMPLFFQLYFNTTKEILPLNDSFSTFNEETLEEIYYFLDYQKDFKILNNKPIIKVYYFDVDEKDKNLVDYNTLFSNYKVEDAIINQEYWYLNDLDLSKNYFYLQIENINLKMIEYQSKENDVINIINKEVVDSFEYKDKNDFPINIINQFKNEDIIYLD